MRDLYGDLHALPELGVVAVPADASDLMLTPRGMRSLPWRSVALDFHGIDPEPVRQLQGLALPPVQSRGIAMIAAGHLLRLREGQRVVMAVENTRHPRAPRPGELNDGQFLGEVAQIADCGIVLDLDRPGPVCGGSRRGLLGVFGALPADRVIAVRIRAGELDRQRGLLAALVARLPRLRAILVAGGTTEVDSRLEAIWRRRGRACATAGLRTGAATSRRQTNQPPQMPYPEGFSRSSRPGAGRRQRGPFSHLLPH